MKEKEPKIKDSKFQYKNISILYTDNKGYLKWGNKEINFDDNFDIRKYINSEEGSKNFDKLLKESCLENKENIDLILKLRCKISHSIVGKVNEIYQRGLKNELKWNLEDMMPIVLDDNGETTLRVERGENVINKNLFFNNYENFDNPRLRELYENDLNKVLIKNKKLNISKNNLRNRYRIYETKSFNYKLIEDLAKKNKIKEKASYIFTIFHSFYKTDFRAKKQRINPFSAEIIYSFDHLNTSEIGYWTGRKVISDNEIKKYLGKYGKLIFQSPWSLLRWIPISTILLACKTFPPYSIDPFNKDSRKELIKKYNKINIERLINNYKKYYPDSNLEFKKDKQKELRKWDVTYGDFYQKIDEGNIFINILNPKTLDKKSLEKDDFTELRKFLLNISSSILKYKRLNLEIDPTIPIKENKSNKINNIIEDTIESTEVEIKEEKDSIKQFINNLIRNQIKSILKNTLKKEIASFEKYPERKQAWCLFASIDLTKITTKDEIDNEFSEITYKIKSNDWIVKTPSWLVKRFNFNICVSTALTNSFIIIKNILNEENYRKKYNLDNKENKCSEELKELLENKFKNIFENLENQKVFIKIYLSEWNPKKGRKDKLILIVRELLNEFKINCKF